MDNPAHRGALRKEPVVIRNPRSRDEIVFVPPDNKDVRKLLPDLLVFIQDNQDKNEPIVLPDCFIANLS